MANEVTVILQQPTSSTQTVSVQGYRTWSTDLLGCFNDIGGCIKGLLCYPCTLCSIASRTGECCCMPFCVPGGDIALRARIRTLGGISGSICNDCLTMVFLGPCAVCQMERELDAMNVH